MKNKNDENLRPVAAEILDVRFVIENYEDLGFQFYWAIDKLKTHLTARILPDGSVLALATTQGKWNVVPGIVTPQSSTTALCPTCTDYINIQEGAATGKITSYFDQMVFPPGTKIIYPVLHNASPFPTPVLISGSFNPKNPVVPCHPPLKFNALGNFQDLVCAPGTQTGTVRIVYFIQAFFSQPYLSHIFKGSYYFDEQLLYESATNQELGDIFINSKGCPQTVPYNPNLK
ncbi:MAG: hypothetical protein Harvfovirus9_26 [Harvfovirus sp.]|uniref:Uncharacterized protein n=1 Tax=Harvfovirus sp. TaxID=2487768 RepID=A0A3G5A0Y4_9VIRU|nr:MAG: hypothetical protein Harvfovirus9_26 [Harvfovirus sp.]